MTIQLSRMLHVLGTHELMCRKSYRMVKLRISVSEMIYILKRVFQLVSILHGAVIITLQTVSHFAVQRVISCVMILSEATMVIAKGRTTNLGRGVCVWNSVHFLPLFFHTWFPPIYFFLLFFLFSLYIPLFFYCFFIPSLFLACFSFFSVPLFFFFGKCAWFPCSLVAFLSFLFIPFLFCKPRHSSDANTGYIKC